MELLTDHEVSMLSVSKVRTDPFFLFPAQVAFVIVRLTPEETLTQKLWGSKFDGPAVGSIDWLGVIWCLSAHRG